MSIDTMFHPPTDDEIKTAHIGNVHESWRPIVPVPAEAPPLTPDAFMRWARPGYSLMQASRYNDAKGELLGFIVRFDNSDDSRDKDIVPLTFCQSPDGARQ